jgi:hypothetical protein
MGVRQRHLQRAGLARRCVDLAVMAHGAAASRCAAPTRARVEHGALVDLLILLLFCVELQSVRFPPKNQTIKPKPNLSVSSFETNQTFVDC